MKDFDARALFERSVGQLDPDMAKRLRLARREALSGAGRAARRWQGAVPAFAAASLLLLGLAWWLPRPAGAPPAPVAVAPAQATPVLDDAVLAEAGEDADLYAWLGDAPVASEEKERRL